MWGVWRALRELAASTVTREAFDGLVDESAGAKDTVEDMLNFPFCAPGKVRGVFN